MGDGNVGTEYRSDKVENIKISNWKIYSKHNIFTQIDGAVGNYHFH